ncbi:MAG: glycosyltransferase [Candidatus Marinimicrobia bacterium]|nr:glycosyltransferase [Candidatus Neomarinimicrobiota bacterium]
MRNEWIRNDVYEHNPLNADGILFNSHHKLLETLNLRKEHPEKTFVHRLDGPLLLGRKYGHKLDRYIFKCNRTIAHGTVFQSPFSKQQCLFAGMKLPSVEDTIMNSPDPSIFYSINKQRNRNGRIRIVATSWSDNWRKGFSIYQYLDEHLDFSKYRMTFIGNSPLKFKNIIYKAPLTSHELSKFLHDQDIFLTASEVDPCSNSLIEALHCGLPAVVRDSGGHPFIVGEAGGLFKNSEDVLEKIGYVSAHLSELQKKISVPNIVEVAVAYRDVFLKAAKLPHNTFSWKSYWLVRTLGFWNKYKNRIK